MIANLDGKYLVMKKNILDASVSTLQFRKLLFFFFFSLVSTLMTPASFSSTQIANKSYFTSINGLWFKPSFNSIENTAVRKAVFFNYLLPAVIGKNTEITKLRELIINDKLDELELEELAIKYRLNLPITKEDLLIAIDVLPPSLVLAQAANESNWGRSRFAEDFNNYFGIWCFVKGCGIVPTKRDMNAKHEVATFDSLKDCIDYYVLTLNRNYAYQNLRAIRKSQRDNLSPVTGIALAEGLKGYAEIGEEYVNVIQAVIRFNNLERHDL
jgi:Bax protein